MESLLRERGLPGEVEHLFSSDLQGRNPEHVFGVKGFQMRVCTLSFPGARGIPEADLLKASKPLASGVYSRATISGIATNTLLKMYRQRGYLRARMGQPIAKPDAACPNGLAVSVRLEEGQFYYWAAPEWVGNHAFRAEQLEAALKMKVGDITDASKLDAGVDALRRAYRKNGYIEARITMSPNFDEAGRRVSYRFAIDEGQQYRMGSFVVAGLPEKEAARLQKSWKLAQGAVYDDVYLAEFLNKTFGSGRAFGGRLPQVNRRRDRERLTVDINITFK